MQSETADFAPGTATWRTRRDIRVVFDLVHYMKTRRQFIKPEVHNILYCHQRRTKPWSQVTCTDNLVKFDVDVWFLPRVAVVVCPSVCLSVRSSVTSWHCTKTAKRKITQTMPYDSSGTLVFWRQRSRRTSDVVTQLQWWRQIEVSSSNQRFWPISRYIFLLFETLLTPIPREK